MKKILILCFLCGLAAGVLQAQPSADSSAVFTGKPGSLPAFKGGNGGWIKFLQANLRAEVPTDNGAPTGKYVSVISFIVDENGNLSDFKIDKNAGYGTGEEGLRVMKLSPAYTPAILNGKPVKYRHKQKFTFKISER